MYIDFHSHILPAADHGSDGIEMSLEQIKYAKAAGVSVIVATPHYYMEDETIDEFLKRREAAYSELVSQNLQGIKVYKGAEVRLGIGIENLDGLEKLCIEGTDYILVEFPPEPWPYWLFDSVKAIARERHLRPICAHIDRYSKSGRDKILKLNIDVQINADAFLESRRHRHEYLRLIADDAVHLLGSDVHGDGKISYKIYSSAVKKIGKLMPAIEYNSERIIRKVEKNRNI